MSHLHASRSLVRAAGGHPTPKRSFSIAIPARREGEMAYPKPRGFLAEKGPFTHRDAAHEGKFARNQEAEQLRALRQRLSEQRGRIDELENYMSQSRIR